MATYSVTIPLTVRLQVNVEHDGEYDAETVLRLAHDKLGDNQINKIDNELSRFGLQVDQIQDDSDWTIFDDDGKPVYP